MFTHDKLKVYHAQRRPHSHLHPWLDMDVLLVERGVEEQRLGLWN